MRVNPALDAYLDHYRYRLTVGIIRRCTFDEFEYLVETVRPLMPEKEVEDLQPSDFKSIIIVLAERWGSVRLRRVRHFLKGWLRFLSDEALIASVPVTGRLETPRYRPQPKDLYSPADIQRLWGYRKPLCRVFLALGLYAGLNPSDLTELSPDHLTGNWLRQDRVKTGAPRKIHLPSHVTAELEKQGLPLRTRMGLITNRNRVCGLWRDWTRDLFGSSRPFTGLRTTLRTIGGAVDPEAVEIAVLGHQGASAAKELGRSTVSLSHYVNQKGISDDRLRAISRAITDYARSA